MGKAVPGPHRIDLLRAAQRGTRAPGRSPELSISRDSMPNAIKPVIKPVAESYWVIEDRLLAGKYPGGKNAQEVERRLGALLAAGFDAFIDLTEPGELPPYEIYLPGHVRYARKPIPDHGVPREPAPHGGDPRRARRGARGRPARLRALPRRHRPHGHGGRLPPDRAGGLLRRGGARRAQRVVAGQRPLGHLAGGARDRRAASPSSTTGAAKPGSHAGARGPRRRAHACASGSRARCSASPWAMRWPRTPSSANPAASRRSATCWAAGLSTCRAAPGPTTRPWRCCSRRACSNARFDAHDQVERFARWQREGYGSATGPCVGISANVARALATAQYKRQPFAGSHDPQQLDKEPLSRVAPVVMYYFADAAAAVARAVEAARITAQAPMVLDCVRLLAAMLHQALAGRDKAAVLRPPRELWVTASTRPEVLAIYEGSYARRPAGDHRRRTYRAGARGGALGFQPQREFSRGRIAGRQPRPRLAMWSRRSTAQLAGAHHGVSAIPGIWRNSLMKQEVVIDTADRLLTHALVTLGT